MRPKSWNAAEKKLSLEHVEVELAKYAHANLLYGLKERLLVRVAALWHLWDGAMADKWMGGSSAVLTKSAFKPFGSVTFWIANVLIGVCKALEPIHDTESNTDYRWQIRGFKMSSLYVMK